MGESPRTQAGSRHYADTSVYGHFSQLTSPDFWPISTRAVMMGGNQRRLLEDRSSPLLHKAQQVSPAAALGSSLHLLSDG